MKRICGLMLKDLYELVSAGRTLKILLLVYLTAGQLFFPSLADVGMLISMMLPINTIGYDDRSGWSRYVLSMPVSRRDIVLSKYILGYLFLAAAFVIRVATAYAGGAGAGVIATSGAAALLGAVYMAIQMPLMLKFGLEQGRMWTMLFTVLFAVGAVYAGEMSSVIASSALPLGILVPLAALALQAVSILISVKVYQNS